MTERTLPTDSDERKDIPLASGCLDYFPAALAGVAQISKEGNDKHNPGQPLHHARGKSADHTDCVLRHYVDMRELLARHERGQDVDYRELLKEVSAMNWRGLALAQELFERFADCPMAPGAKNDCDEGDRVVRRVLGPKVTFCQVCSRERTFNEAMNCDREPCGFGPSRPGGRPATPEECATMREHPEFQNREGCTVEGDQIPGQHCATCDD